MEINYITKKTKINGQEFTSYVFDGEEFSKASEEIGGIMEIAICGIASTANYPPELEDCPAVFLMHQEPDIELFPFCDFTLYYIPYNPLTGEKFVFKNQKTVDFSKLFEELDKAEKKTRSRSKIEKIDRIINGVLSVEVLPKEEYEKLYKENDWKNNYGLDDYKDVYDIDLSQFIKERKE